MEVGEAHISCRTNQHQRSREDTRHAEKTAARDMKPTRPDGVLDEAPVEPSEQERGDDQRGHHGYLRRRNAAYPREREQWLMPQIGAVTHQSDIDHPPQRKQASGERAAPAEEDDQRRTPDREKRENRRESCGVIENHDCEQNHSQTDHRKGRTRPDNVPGQIETRDRPYEQFPGAGGGQVEVGVRNVPRPPFAQAETNHGRRDQAVKHLPRTEAPDHDEEQREEHVVLLFNGEAPSMEQRELISVGRKIPAFTSEEHVRREETDRDQALGIILELRALHPEPREGNRHRHNEKQGGKIRLARRS
jgi:hypothetical protein